MADHPVDLGSPGSGTVTSAASGEGVTDVTAATRARGHLLGLRRALVNVIDKLGRRRLLALAGASAFVFLLVILALDYGSPAWAYDFHAYYDATQRLIVSGTPYQPDRTLNGPFMAGPYGLYLYSPVPAVAMLPLAYMPVTIAAIVFAVIRLAILLLICATMPISWTARVAVFAVACLSAPVIQDLNLGNASLIVTFLAVLAWRFLDRPAGAAAIAASVAIRPTMALFTLWWLVRRRWKPVLWTVAVALGLVALTLPFVGIAGWLDYARVIGNLTDFEHVYRNFALGALVVHVGAPGWLGEAALFAGYAVAVGAILLSLRRDRELSFVVTLGATMLLSPLLWDHYLTNLLVPAAFLAGRGRWWGLLLPLLCWLPQGMLVFIAIGGLLLPFAAPDKGETVRSVLDLLPGWRRQPAPA